MSFTSENPKKQKATFSQKGAVSFFLSDAVALGANNKAGYVGGCRTQRRLVYRQSRGQHDNTQSSKLDA